MPTAYQYLTAPLRRVTSHFTRRIFWHLNQNKLPLELHQPINFLATKQLDPEAFEVSKKIEGIRRELSASREVVLEPEVFYSKMTRKLSHLEIKAGADTTRLKHTNMKQLVRASKNRRWGIFLFMLARSSQAKRILELGACAGISGCYLGSSPYVQQIISIEGSKPRAHIARRNLLRVTDKAEVINELIDDALDAILPRLKEIDLAFIDGHHQKEATIHYWKRIKPNLTKSALVVFDDIRWSLDMLEAWEYISNLPGFSYCVDLGSIGICKWVDGNAKSQRFTL